MRLLPAFNPINQFSCLRGNDNLPTKWTSYSPIRSTYIKLTPLPTTHLPLLRPIACPLWGYQLVQIYLPPRPYYYIPSLLLLFLPDGSILSFPLGLSLLFSLYQQWLFFLLLYYFHYTGAFSMMVLISGVAAAGVSRTFIPPTAASFNIAQQALTSTSSAHTKHGSETHDHERITCV